MIDTMKPGLTAGLFRSRPRERAFCGRLSPANVASGLRNGRRTAEIPWTERVSKPRGKSRALMRRP